MNSPTILIVIVTHNSAGCIGDCILALRTQSHTSFMAAVVDNASTDETLVAVAKHTLGDSRFIIIANEQNPGFAGGTNIGMRAAHSDLVVTLNPDVLPQPMWLESIVRCVAANPSVDLFGSMQYTNATLQTLDGGGDRYLFFGLAWRDCSHERARRATAQGMAWYPTFSPCAAAAAYRRNLLESIGGFSESFFCYYEDVDLGLRAQLHGSTCLQVIGAQAIHATGKSSSHNNEVLRAYYSLRNMVWCYARGMPALILLAGCVIHVALIVWLIAASPTAQINKARRRALRDALLGLPRILRDRLHIQRSRRATLSCLIQRLDWNLYRYRNRRGGPT